MTAPHHQQVTCTHDCQFFLVANVLCIAVWSDSQAAVSAGKSAGADSQSAEGNRPPAHPQRFHRPHPASHRCPLPLHPIYPLTFDRSPAICYRIPDYAFGPGTGSGGSRSRRPEAGQQAHLSIPVAKATLVMCVQKVLQHQARGQALASLVATHPRAGRDSPGNCLPPKIWRGIMRFVLRPIQPTQVI